MTNKHMKIIVCLYNNLLAMSNNQKILFKMRQNFSTSNSFKMTKIDF